jgi:dTDP-4-amino-4,6-dideoxygalactose transaminase
MASEQIKFVDLARQNKSIEQELTSEINRSLLSGIAIDGPYTDSLERSLVNMTGFGFAVTVNSGTQALELMAKYVRKKAEPILSSNTAQQPGYRHAALVPALTFRATANALIRAGWDIEFGDVDYNGLLIQPDGVEYTVGVPVGLYGQNFPDDERFMFDFMLLDGAQSWLGVNSDKVAWNTRLNAPHAYHSGLAAQAISFDPTKNLAANGNGGAVLTNNKTMAEWVRKMRCHGVGRSIASDVIGTNSRISEIDAATLTVKLRHIGAWQKRRRDIAKYWNDRFQYYPIRSFVTKENIDAHGLQKYAICLQVPIPEVIAILSENGIQTKRHYELPLHELPVFSSYANPGCLSTASMLARSVVSLPFYPELSDAEVEYIADSTISAVTTLSAQTFA